MCLAESLLRVPDAATADKLIRDKIGNRDWARHLNQSDSLFVNASTAWALMLAGRVVTQLDDAAGKWQSFDGIWKKLVARSDEPVIRQAVTMMAMRILGKQFVLGRNIEEALKESRAAMAEGYRYSFDMLGEAAYTQSDAARYYASYKHALTAIAEATSRPVRAGLRAAEHFREIVGAASSRYEWAKRDRIFAELFAAAHRPRRTGAEVQSRLHHRRGGIRTSISISCSTCVRGDG